MSAAEKGQVMTANRLRDGEVVFLTQSGFWSEKIDDATLVQQPEAVAAVETKANDDVNTCVITGQYLFEATRIGGKIRADHIRERIRTLGPSVRLDLGKQAEGKAGAFAPVEA